MPDRNYSHGRLRASYDAGSKSYSIVISDAGPLPIALGRAAEALLEEFGGPVLIGNMPLLLNEGFALCEQALVSGEVNDAARLADACFNAFTPIWREANRTGKHTLGLQLWIELIRAAIEWETATGRHLHKGSAFFFATVASWYLGNLDYGFRFLHAAIADDLELNRLTGINRRDYPAMLTASLSADSQNFLHGEVVLQRASLATALNRFTAATGKPLTMANVEERFLNETSLTDERVLFVYLLNWLDKWNLLSRVIPENDAFSMSRRLTVYQGLTVVIDKLLRRVTGKDYLGGSVHSVMQTSYGLNSTQTKQLARMDSDPTAWETNFEATLADVLTNIGDPIKRGLVVSWGIRNHAAHSASAAPILVSRANEIEQALLDALFLALCR